MKALNKESLKGLPAVMIRKAMNGSVAQFLLPVLSPGTKHPDLPQADYLVEVSLLQLNPASNISRMMMMEK